MKLAIITGASSGLGREYAKIIDSKTFVDEIWLIARRKERLDELAATLTKRTRVFALDLTKVESFRTLRGELQNTPGADVQWLVANAGFGKIGLTEELTLHDAAAMIDLNCRAAILTTQIALPYMKKDAHIMEIASCAAFEPIPGLNVYAATKAFLLRYSQALGEELQPRKIKVTAVCPYWIKDTEFIRIAQKSAGGKRFKRLPRACKAESVALRSFYAAQMGKKICTPDLMSALTRTVAALIPDELIMKVSKLFHKG